MTNGIQKVTKEEQLKKSTAQITKCINEFDKILTDEKEEKVRKAIKLEDDVLPKQKNSRYELLQKAYH